jgi:hypothetical protein
VRKGLLSFLLYYSTVHFVDTEWLLSTLFDASLLSLSRLKNGGSFYLRVSNQDNAAFFAAAALRRPVITIGARPRNPWTRRERAGNVLHGW